MKTDYIIITPTHNEEQNMKNVIKSVIAQTILPKKWVIVNDRSTDKTDKIIKQYEKRYHFITDIKIEDEDSCSYYGHRTRAVLKGYEQIKNLEYDFISVLDADITLEPTYFQNILTEFERNPELGLAGSLYIYQIGNIIEKPLISPFCVPGSNQTFRKECYEQIGGYIPLKYGGDDTLANVMTRMYGWKTKTFNNNRVIQNRLVGTRSKGSILKARFQQGLTDYGLSIHPLFMFAKLFRRAFMEKPYITGSAARFTGFLAGYLKHEKRTLPDNVVSFIRKEQLERLKFWKREKSCEIK